MSDAGASWSRGMPVVSVSKTRYMRTAPSGAALPPPRVSLRVHARHDNDRVTVDSVEKAVWKSLGNESAAGVPVKDGKGLWLFEHSVACHTERLQELVAQAWPLRL